MNEVKFDWARQERTGLPEVVLASNKSASQLAQVVDEATRSGRSIFFTRLSVSQASQLALPDVQFHYDPVSSTGTLGRVPAPRNRGLVAIVAAGSSDFPVAAEVAATLRFLGHEPNIFIDVGVAGLWRLLDRIDEIRQSKIVVAVAGMEGALFSVIGGLVKAPVIAVPTSVGYGVAKEGHAALSSALASCSPGILTVNIDNGFGAAAAAIKILNILDFN